MRISELSRATGVPVPTVKYYLREGLLPPGRPTGRNQADYGDEHARRLRLVRILVEVGGLNIAAVRQIVQALDDAALPMHLLLGTVHYALMAERPAAEPDVQEALADVGRYLDRLGWEVDPAAPARRTFAQALVAVRRLGYPVAPEDFAVYAEHADQIAAWELEHLPDGPRAAVVEMHVIGTVVFGAILSSLRYLAQEHYSAKRFGA